uniref:Uncharacterized protein n=1 Tax=Meloidogyne incognita TaxID=6306 RepID=A0A914MWG3_MELIC
MIVCFALYLWSPYQKIAPWFFNIEWTSRISLTFIIGSLFSHQLPPKLKKNNLKLGYMYVKLISDCHY